MKPVIVVNVLLILYVASALGAAIPITRKPNKIIENPTRNQQRLLAGDAIPLEGGLLVLGTYVISVQVGTPPVTVSMIVDTGSSNTALPATGCQTCGSGNVYDTTKSTTFQPMPCNSAACTQCYPTGSTCTDCDLFFGDSFCGATNTTACGFGVTYGGGSSSIYGYYGMDNVCMGDLCSQITLSLIESEYPAGSLQTDQSTGILGLASEYNACNPTCVPPILDYYVNAGLTSNNFAVCLTGSNGGVLDVGYINSTRFTGSLQYVPITLDRWYNVQLLDIQIGPHSIGLPPFLYTTTNDVIGTFIDTGTSVILMNPVSFQYFQNTFTQFYANLPGIAPNSGFFGSVPCLLARQVNVLNYPDVTFVFKGANGNVALPVPASSYLIPSGDLYCFGIGGIPSVGVVLGDVFMENYYIVFDRANSRLGFAPVVSANCN